jgi:hypothetical protein
MPKRTRRFSIGRFQLRVPRGYFAAPSYGD